VNSTPHLPVRKNCSLPSGRFAANAAWLTLAAMAHNLTPAAGCLTSPRYAKARAATIRTTINT
jgi:hypothetical protein